MGYQDLPFLLCQSLTPLRPQGLPGSTVIFTLLFVFLLNGNALYCLEDDAFGLDDTPSKSSRVIRRGVYMGMDPGLVGRFEPDGMPVYFRLNLRIGGCISSRLLLGADWRMDLLAGGGQNPPEKRHTIGPVLSLFLVQGWFVRGSLHVGGIQPFLFNLGAQTGYEFSFGRYGAVGFAFGSSVDIPVDGELPRNVAVSGLLFLSAYDLGTRRGREPGL